MAALQRQLARADRAHLYVFTGPPGVGKTTLARIISSTLGNDNPMELDGPSHAGVDDMRELRDYVQYKSLDGKPRVVIIDEAHALSKAAWQASLKVMEEPPDHVYFILCTSEASKIPAANITRAFSLQLRPVGTPELMAYAEKIIKQEDIVLPDNAIRYIIAGANGSPRQMLVDINRCDGAKDLIEVQKLMDAPSEDEEDATMSLARMIASGRVSFKKACAFLAKARTVEGRVPEAVRIVLVEYLTSAVLNANEPKMYLVPYLDMLSQPVQERGGYAALVSICANLMATEGK